MFPGVSIAVGCGGQVRVFPDPATQMLLLMSVLLAGLLVQVWLKPWRASKYVNLCDAFASITLIFFTFTAGLLQKVVSLQIAQAFALYFILSRKTALGTRWS